MPRSPRGLADGFVYHVLNRGNNKQRIFHKDYDYKIFLDLMSEAKDRYQSLKLLGYCLMPNHFHMVVQPGRGDELSKWIHWLICKHVRRYHYHYEKSGHLWQGRFKSFVVQDDEHLLTVLRYVECNPVRAGLVATAGDWPWSSHRERTGTAIRSLTDQLPIDLPGDWPGYVDEPLTDQELEKLHTSVVRQSPYGASMWQKKVARELGLESTLKPRGRPRTRLGGSKGQGK